MAKTPGKFETPYTEYFVSRVIGEGGAGRVFCVHDSADNQFALKCLFPEVATTEKRKRFKNEINFSSRQHHRNLIQVVDSGLVIWGGKKTSFYVMPFFSMTLRTLINKGIDANQVLPLFNQILDGVEAAHLLSVTHRDLKPENILYDSNQNLLVVADFGIAHFEEDIIATAVETKDAARLANFRYSAPEQRTPGSKVDQRSDIYALGLMLNEMFTGITPHGSGYKTVKSVSADYAYLDQLIDRMIQQAPSARPSTIEEIKKELIGRKNSFVALQKFDSKRQEVLPSSAPQQFSPLTLKSCDWDDGTLILELDRVPDPGWVARFRSPRTGVSSIYGAEPGNFQFQGKAARVRAHEDVAQLVINHFKSYIHIANQGYQQDLRLYIEEQERAKRQKLELEVAEAEKRARILKNLKI